MVTAVNETNDSKLVQIGPYIREDQVESLRKAAFHTRLTRSAIVQAALDDWLAKNKA